MTSRLAMDVIGGGSTIPAEAIVSAIDPRNINVGIKNPAYEAGQSDQEFYNRKALPWEGAAYAVSPTSGDIIKVGGRPDAASGPEIQSDYPNLAEVWARFAAAQQNRDPNPGSLTALYADQRSVAQDIGNVGRIDPSQGEGQSLAAEKVRERQAASGGLTVTQE